MELKKEFYNKKLEKFEELKLKYFFTHNELRDSFYHNFELDENNAYITFLILYKDNGKLSIQGKRMGLKQFRDQFLQNMTLKRMVEIDGNYLQTLWLRVVNATGRDDQMLEMYQGKKGAVR